MRWFDVIDSTNRYLLECAAAGAGEGMVAVADEQTAGRGRLGRTWVARPGSALLVSVLLRPQLAPERVHLLTLASADEAFLTSTTREVQPIAHVDGVALPAAPGPVSKRLAAAFSELVGRETDP